MTKFKFKNIILTLLSGSLILSMTACSSVNKEVHKTAPIAQTLDEDTYTYVFASLSNVVSTQDISVTYSSSKSWALSFNRTSYTISNAYFEKGDEVKKGDLLIECDPYDSDGNPLNIQETMDELNEEYDTYTSQIEYYTSLAELEKERQIVYIKYNQEFDSTNLDYYNKMIEDITKDLNVVKYEIEENQDILDECKLYAPEDGTIGYIASESKTNKMVAADIAVTVISKEPSITSVISDKAQLELLNIGEVYDINFKIRQYLLNNHGLDEDDYDGSRIFDEGYDEIVVEKNMKAKCVSIEPTSELNTSYEVTFEYVSGDSDFTSRTIIGNISITIAEADNVVSIPSSAIFGVSDGYAVYVENDDGSRGIREVEVGLVSSSLAEIKSGLEAGDCIITDANSTATITIDGYDQEDYDAYGGYDNYDIDSEYDDYYDYGVYEDSYYEDLGIDEESYDASEDDSYDDVDGYDDAAADNNYDEYTDDTGIVAD